MKQLWEARQGRFPNSNRSRHYELQEAIMRGTRYINERIPLTTTAVIAINRIVETGTIVDVTASLEKKNKEMYRKE